jgi:riboflavin kinase/FMN adenylyltransferase
MATLPLTLTATVKHGDKIGRTVGFPTANLDVAQLEIDLAPGVYFGTCEFQGNQFYCLPYWGPRLILGEEQLSFEVYILDFDQDVYGQQLTVIVEQQIREPIKFATLEELQQQLQQDVAQAKTLINQRP